MVLTEFSDTTSPRPGIDELYFTKSEDQTDKERPPIIVDRVVWVDDESAQVQASAQGEITSREFMRKFGWPIGGGAILLGLVWWRYVVRRKQTP